MAFTTSFRRRFARPIDRIRHKCQYGIIEYGAGGRAERRVYRFSAGWAIRNKTIRRFQSLPKASGGDGKEPNGGKGEQGNPTALPIQNNPHRAHIVSKRRHPHILSGNGAR